MMTQIILITFSLLFPFFLALRKNEKALIYWITIIIVVDIFNSQYFLNLSAIKLCSLALFPFSIKYLKEAASSKSSFCLLLFLTLTASLGVYFGHIAPWEDTTLARSFKDLPPMRVILHTGSLLLEVHLAVALGLRLKKRQNFKFLISALSHSFAFMILGALIELIFHIDLYHLFTQGRAYLDPNRLRGFNYEPRGLAQASAYALLLSPLISSKIFRLFIITFSIILGFVYTMSVTGFVTLIMGLLIAIPFYFLTNRDHEQRNKSIKVVALSTIILIGLTALTFSLNQKLRNKFYYHLIDRAYIIQPGSLVSKLEVFDAASMNFLLQNKSYLWLGTGPGLIYLPASPYIIERDKKIWGDHFNALPHMGALLIIANTGLIGFTLWLLFIFFGFKVNWNYWKKYPTDPVTRQRLYLYTLTMLLYFLQIRYFVLIGIALTFLGSSKQYELDQKSDNNQLS